MASAWGSSWGTAWGDSWGATGGAVVESAFTGGGALWDKGRYGKKRKKRILTEAEFAHEQDRLAELARRTADSSVALSRVTEEGNIEGESVIEDDDLIIKAALLRILH